MNSAVKKLIALFLRDVQRLTKALDGGSVEAWKQQFSQALAKYHTAALLVGQGNTTLTPQGRRYLGKVVQAQLKYLNNFAVEIQDAAEFRPGWLARAALYAQGIGASYWKGATKMLPLPAMPRDGTSPCLSNCGCAWSIDELDGDGNYDCTWTLGALEHCQVCKQRANDWAPLRIRNGELA